jgi:glycosyltransferase involved in cell wall biosynthesis
MRNNKRVVYGSSYDRGLEHLLKMWPEIKAEVPEAELHIFYGWNLFDRAYTDNPAMQEWKEKMNELMVQDGITHLGRISHEGVKKEFENAGVWAYPTHFGEISCITAMKAQAYGAIPVVINYAALVETVQHGVKVDGDIYDQETKDEFKR